MDTQPNYQAHVDQGIITVALCVPEDGIITGCEGGPLSKQLTALTVIA